MSEIRKTFNNLSLRKSELETEKEIYKREVDKLQLKKTNIVRQIIIEEKLLCKMAWTYIPSGKLINRNTEIISIMEGIKSITIDDNLILEVNGNETSLIIADFNQLPKIIKKIGKIWIFFDNLHIELAEIEKKKIQIKKLISIFQNQNA